MNSDPDPFDFEGVDREIRLENLRRRIEELGGELMINKDALCDPDVEEAFLEQILAFESAEGVQPLDVLREEGFNFPPPEELDDDSLTAKLWELIRTLAAHRLYLDSTDHLSDRELYAWLWRDALRKEYAAFGQPPGNWHVDVLGSCSEEDIVLQMRFYANEEERASWAENFPDFAMPPSEEPPFDRDRHLPQAYPDA